METNIQELREDLINYVGSSMLPNKYAIIAYIESLSNDELIDFIKNNPKVMPYFDIPLQHSEDKILKLMKRRGMRDFLVELIAKIRKEIPNAIFRTTMIVGFPQETEEDVDSLIEMMGGNKAFTAKLDSLFWLENNTVNTGFVSDVTGLIGQYAHGNEPSHHVAYLCRGILENPKTYPRNL